MLWLMIGLGMVLVVEGLVLALAPSRIEDMLDMMRQMPIETRRTVGLIAVALGVVILWGGKTLLGS
jgi:uncharacterized protein YjeT (DUF2065 family)